MAGSLTAHAAKRLRAALAAAAILAGMGAGSIAAPDDAITTRPGVAEAEQSPAATAQCPALHASLDDLPDLDRRIDLWVVGELKAVQTDGALWYLVMCSLPDLRIMCVTYESNDMKIGDRVIARGAYTRLDPNHATLDPCLATLENRERH